MSTGQSLARIGAVAAFGGAVVLLVSTLLHPSRADPNDPSAAFAEYAADSLWIASHLSQFVGFAVLGMALIALANTFEPGRASAWARMGVAGTVTSMAVAAALQSVDGVALKAMVDRWAAAAGEARLLAYESAFAVRQIEIGLASLLSLVSGFTLTAFGIAIALSIRYPRWLGVIGVLGGVGTIAAGVTQAFTGFSGLAMTLSLVAGAVLLIWATLAGIHMWRLFPNLLDDREAE